MSADDRPIGDGKVASDAGAGVGAGGPGERGAVPAAAAPTSGAAPAAPPAGVAVEVLSGDDAQLPGEPGPAAPAPSADGSSTGPTVPPVVEQPDPRVGAVYGKYRIIRRLGRGGMGVVYLGEDTVLKRGVAIKFLPDDLNNKTEVVERFIREAQVAGRLSHPNIIAIHDVAMDKRGCYMVMELLDPHNARSRLNKGPYPWQIATRIMADCCEALKVAHDAGIIHRDVKPDNILFSPAGVVKLVDFGLVKLLQDDLNLTQTGMLCGTPLYMSPEQASNQVMDVRSDLYSLGATYFTLLTSRPPFLGPGVPQILLSHIQDPTPDPRELVENIPESCVRVLRRAMEKRRELRYQSASEMGEDLEQILVGMSLRTASVFAMEEGLAGQKDGATPNRTGSFVGQESRSLAAMLHDGNAAAGSGSLPRRALLALAGLGAIGISVGTWFELRGRRGTGSTSTPIGGDPPGRVPRVTVDSRVIKVGILHSLTGALAVSERPIRDASMLAIDEINAAGGLLGRRVDPRVVDGKSEVTANSGFARGAEQLLNEEKVAVVFGGFGSASRKVMLPYFESSNRLLFYPAQYEGLEAAPNVIYTGATPNQMVIPSILWALKERQYTRFYFVGTDGVRARAINLIAEDTLKEAGGEVVGSDYALVGESQFAHIIRRIKHAKPQLVIHDLVGDSGISFFRELAEASISAEEQPVLSFTTSENELAQLGSSKMAGHYIARTCFPATPGTTGDTFAARFRARYGEDSPVSELMESAYYGVLLWAEAVRRTGSEDTTVVRSAVLEKEYDIKGVHLRLDPSTQHTYKVFQLARVTPHNTLEVIKTDDKPIRPNPFPPPRTNTDWKNWTDDLYRHFGNNWSNPKLPQVKKAK